MILNCEEVAAVGSRLWILAEEAMLVLSNPLCSKCRQLLSYLRDKGIECTVREYLKDPLSAEEILELADKLELAVSQWTREAVSENLEQAAQQIADRPEILQRPIVIDGARATVARSLPEFELWLKGPRS